MVMSMSMMMLLLLLPLLLLLLLIMKIMMTMVYRCDNDQVKGDKSQVLLLMTMKMTKKMARIKIMMIVCQPG